MRPIESAVDLHREIRKRGLELRPDLGRDATLLAEVASKLGVSPHRFVSELKGSGKSAEEYLRALMSVAKPFALMFKEIWSFLARYTAPKASESLIVRFGFGHNKDEIDWDKFRVMAQTASVVRSFGPALIWREEHLFELSRFLTRNLVGGHYRGYQPGAALTLPFIGVQDNPGEIVERVRLLLQDLIDAIHAVWSDQIKQGSGNGGSINLADVRSLPELLEPSAADERPRNRQQRSMRDLAFLLTDLIPAWNAILEGWNQILVADKARMQKYFREVVEPTLRSATAPGWTRIQEALDLLELPFWRHRWHTYEVWASVKAFEGLARYRPEPTIRDGYIALDGANPALVAVLKSNPTIYAHVQAETRLATPLGKRRAIRPDLRFSLDDPATNPATIAIIEYKQRHHLDSGHVSEVATAYSLGVGICGGVVIINYDAPPCASLPSGCVMLGNVNPAYPENVESYQAAVRDCFARAEFEPRGFSVVLLDVSGSMDCAYTTASAQSGLKRLLEFPWLKIFRFNDGLLPGGDLTNASTVATRGGTQLGAALQQLFPLLDSSILERLLVVTDGGHDHPDEFIPQIKEYQECMPSEIEKYLEWLNAV
ncbi:MAG: hypothetical protein QOG67_168 [Verrucomicrobiota bacterium]|jgi:hypothetical protein